MVEVGRVGLEGVDGRLRGEVARGRVEGLDHDREAGGLRRLEDLLPLPGGELRRLQLLALRVAAREEIRRPEHRERDRVRAGLEGRLDEPQGRVRVALVGGADVGHHEAGLSLSEQPAAERERRRLHPAPTLPRAASRSRATTRPGSSPGLQSRDGDGLRPAVRPGRVARLRPGRGARPPRPRRRPSSRGRAPAARRAPARPGGRRPRRPTATSSRVASTRRTAAGRRPRRSASRSPAARSAKETPRCA